MQKFLSYKVKRVPFFVLALLFIVYGCTRSESKISEACSGEKFEETDTRYYSSIVFRETPYARQKGMIKLTREQAGNRAHYQFIFDVHERIVEIAFRQGAHYKAPNHTSDYYQFPAPIIRTKYEKNKEIKSFFNRFNTQISVRGSVYNEVYELDSLGNRVHLYYLNENGEKIENEWNVAGHTWKVQDDGAVIEKRFNLKGALQPLRPYFLFYITRLHYDPNGYISLMQNIDEHGNLVENETGVAQDKIEYDSKGRWLGWKVLDKNGKLTEGNGPNVARGINTPNEFGYEAGIRYEDRNGNALRNRYGFWGSRRFYDESGNFTHTYFVDSLGNPAPNEVSGYTYAIYTWGKEGINRLSSELLDTNKRPIPHKTRGYSTIKYEYDTKNRLVKASFFNEEGMLTNRLDNGVAYITYAYDENGIRTSRTEFDSSHKEITVKND